MQRILVIRGGAIGDFVLTLPAIKLLRDEYPDARLEILAYKHIAALAENRYYADATRSIEYGALASFFASRGELNDELSRYFGSFDLVVSYLFDPDGIFQRNLQRCGVDTLVGGPPKIAEGGEHAAIQLARPLEELGLRLRDRAAQLYPSNDDREFAREFVGADARPIAIHPGSGSATKNWPIEKWKALVAALGDREPLVIGGEADERQLAALRGANARRALNLPLPQLAALIERCALFVGHDSGVSHIAAAVGTRCVLLFGPTHPDVWAPANTSVQVIRPATANLTDITVEQVLDAIRAATTS